MYRLIKYRWPQLLGATVATNIYAGVMSDTGNFRFPRVTASTHRMVAELLECGADPVDIYNRMNNTWSMAKTRLLGSVLSTMELHCNGQLCTLTVPYSLVEQEHCSVDDLEGMVHYTLSVAGVRCGVLIAERGNGSDIKLSFRSKGDVVVNGVAATFGGGGHIYAAGARTSQASLLQVKDEVIARITAVLPA
jgi:phosphoesterase RecJ-like protein